MVLGRGLRVRLSTSLVALLRGACSFLSHSSAPATLQSSLFALSFLSVHLARAVRDAGGGGMNLKLVFRLTALLLVFDRILLPLFPTRTLS